MVGHAMLSAVMMFAIVSLGEAAGDDLECSVCKALVKEMKRGLKKTTGKQNLDLRGRLDPNGTPCCRGLLASNPDRGFRSHT